MLFATAYQHVCDTKYVRYLARTDVPHTRSVEEIAIHDSYKNVRETDPLKQIVQEQVEGL